MTEPLSLTDKLADAQKRPAPVPVPQSERVDPEYLVLSKDASGFWSESKRITARSPEAAILAAIGDTDPGKSQWVAVAARYWSPTSFEVKVERTLIAKAVS